VRRDQLRWSEMLKKEEKGDEGREDCPAFSGGEKEEPSLLAYEGVVGLCLPEDDQINLEGKETVSVGQGRRWGFKGEVSKKTKKRQLLAGKGKGGVRRTFKAAKKSEQGTLASKNLKERNQHEGL